MTTPPRVGHSAQVRMHLSVNGRVFFIRQLGPEFAILDTPGEHPPAEADLVLSVDGRETRWRVYLPRGISAISGQTAIARSRT